MCVCVRETERESVCVCVCVCERESVCVRGDVHSVFVCVYTCALVYMGGGDVLTRVCVFVIGMCVCARAVCVCVCTCALECIWGEGMY